MSNSSVSIDASLITTYPAFYGPVLPYLKAVKQSIQAIHIPSSSLLAQGLSSAVQTRGKLIRPVMTLLLGLTLYHAQATTGEEQPPEPVINALIETAAVAEMIHLATLLHDDVLDESDTRRGQPTVKFLHGNRVSILSGDYLLAQASIKLASIGHIRLVAIFSDVLAQLCNGELLQAQNSFSTSMTWQDYEQKCVCKTASLFAACCEAASVIMQLPQEQTEAYRLFGESIGLAFQIMDDLLDYTATEAQLGKPVLGDLKQGLLNAPVLLILKDPDTPIEAKILLNEQIAGLFEAVQNNDITRMNTKAEQIKHQLESLHVADKTLDYVGHIVNHALALLSHLPASPNKAALIELVQYVVARSN
jgi:geranylgeranyl pyrophosphate synthase